MLFKDRREAGNRLAAVLAPYRDRQALVLAVPRGGVVVAAPVAASLAAELDLIIPRKVGLPGNPELAVAAVAPDGTVLYNQPALSAWQLRPEDIRTAIARELEEIKRRLAIYRAHKREPEIKGRVVIVIDDGIATGMTIEAALQSIKKAAPASLVLAVPVAPPDTIARLQSRVDHLVCLATPESFYAVGQFYEKFEQVTDAEVRNILATAGLGS